MNHADLVKRAGRWLANTRKCVLSFQEANCWGIREFPDAIGWTIDGYSILVECKTNLKDFHRDKHKPAKYLAKASGGETMGRERWFLTPAGLLAPEQLPEGSGLLEVRGRVLRRVVEAATDERPGRQDAELPLLLWAARKQAWKRGYSARMVKLAFVREGGQ